MNRLELWLLRKLIRKAMQKTATRKRLFQMLWLAYQTRFHEDNAPTRLADLQAHLDSQYKEEIILAERLRDYASYINIAKGNPERVLRDGPYPDPYK